MNALHLSKESFVFAVVSLFVDSSLIPFLLRKRANDYALIPLDADDVMEHIDGAVKVSEITELLRAEYAIVTGEIQDPFVKCCFRLSNS